MRKPVVILMCLLLASASCSYFDQEPERVAVAECYGVKLYADELKDILPSSDIKMDSLAQVNAYIDSWIRKQVLVHQAEINLSPEQLDFTRQIEDYRNSLVIYAYESQLIDQYLDTVVSQEEIAAYYEAHKENFQLRSTMVKAAYVILEEDCKQEKEFKKLLSNRDTLDLVQLDILASTDAVSSFFDVDAWLKLDDLLAIVPIEIYNYESFFRKNRFVSFEKDNYLYMVYP